MLKFRIPFLPPSINKAYGWDPARKTQYLKKEARLFKINAKLFIPKLENHNNRLIKIDVELHGNWYYKNGNVKKHDAQNLTKILYDAIFERFGIDDCYIFEYSGKKVQSKDEATVVSVELIGDSHEQNETKLSSLEAIKLRRQDK